MKTSLETGAGGGLLGLIARLFWAIGGLVGRYRTWRELSQLSDRSLKDLGLTRSEIERVSRFGRE